MKYLYFLRHAESKANAAGRHFGEQDSLTQAGEAQARAVADTCKKSSADVLLTSTMIRAKQTAEIINETLDLTIVENSNLNERAHPSEIDDQPKDGERVIEIEQTLRENADEPHWHYSDEENFVELRERVLTVLRELRDRDEERMLVVTHANVMTMIEAVAQYGMYVDPEEYYALEDGREIENTEVVEIRIHDDRGLGKALELVSDTAETDETNGG